MPVPACWPVLVCSKWRNSFVCSSAEMPGPVSSTSTRRWGAVDPRRSTRTAQADTAPFRELDGVTQHVDEDLAQFIDIAHDVSRDVADQLHDERQSFPVRPDAEHHLQVVEQGGEIECGEIQGGAACLDLGHLEDVINQGEQVFAAPVDDPQVLVLPDVEVLVAQHELGETEDGIHGGADLVRHVRQEGALGAVGGLGRLLGLDDLLLGSPALGHVLHRQDQQLSVMARLELAGVEQHHPTPDSRERMLELEVVEDRALGDDILEKRPQVGDIPLAVAQLIDQAVFGLLGRDLEGLIEGIVGGPDA